MINQGNNVPDNTIAVFRIAPDDILPEDRLGSIIFKSPKKRDWFTPNFYRCLPLTIGNQYGFQISCEFDFGLNWDGTDNADAISFYFNKDLQELNNLFPTLTSHFGNGIFTIMVPYVLRTPPGVNLMTINPTNSIVNNVTVMSGVVETDNLRHNFTFNIKVQEPNKVKYYPAGTPIAGFRPIPRYFADQFELKMAEDLFTQEDIKEELESVKDFTQYRTNIDPTLPNGVNRQYFNGKDIYGNMFLDHQKP
jgi:hypothetical protein